MTAPNIIAELFRNGAVPGLEDKESLRAMGSFAATVLARLVPLPKPAIGAGADAMMAALATQQGGVGNASRWLDGIGIGSVIDDSFWQDLGTASAPAFGYDNFESQFENLQLMEEEGVKPEADTQVVDALGGKRPSLFGRRSQSASRKSGPSRVPSPRRAQGVQAEVQRDASAATSPRAAHSVWAMRDGSRVAIETLRQLALGGLPTADQPVRPAVAGANADAGRVGSPTRERRNAPTSVRIDGLTVDGRLPALAASLQTASMIGAASERSVSVALPRAPRKPAPYAFFDSADATFLTLGEALDAQRSVDPAVGRESDTSRIANVRGQSRRGEPSSFGTFAASPARASAHDVRLQDVVPSMERHVRVPGPAVTQATLGAALSPSVDRGGSAHAAKGAWSTNVSGDFGNAEYALVLQAPTEGMSFETLTQSGRSTARQAAEPAFSPARALPTRSWTDMSGRAVFAAGLAHTRDGRITTRVRRSSVGGAVADVVSAGAPWAVGGFEQPRVSNAASGDFVESGSSPIGRAGTVASSEAALMSPQGGAATADRAGIPASRFDGHLSMGRWSGAGDGAMSRTLADRSAKGSALSHVIDMVDNGRAMPLGATFTSYETFTIGHMAEMAEAASAAVVGGTFSPTHARGGGQASRGRDWVDSAVDGAVWLRLFDGTETVGGPGSERTLGLSALPEGRAARHVSARAALRSLVKQSSNRQADGAMVPDARPSARPAGRATQSGPADRSGLLAGLPVRDSGVVAGAGRRMDGSAPAMMGARGSDDVQRLVSAVRAGGLVLRPGFGDMHPAGVGAESVGDGAQPRQASGNRASRLAKALRGPSLAMGPANDGQGRLATGTLAQRIVDAGASTSAQGLSAISGTEVGLLPGVGARSTGPGDADNLEGARYADAVRSVASFRQAMLRPVPTARESLAYGGLFATETAASVFGAVARRANMSDVVESVAPSLLGALDGRSRIGNRVASITTSGPEGFLEQVQRDTFGASPAVREMLMRRGWQAAELEYLMPASANAEIRAGETAPTSHDAALSHARADRMGRNLARTVSNSLSVGGHADSRSAGPAVATAVARQQASAYLGALAGMAPEPYFGTGAPSAGLAGRLQGSVGKRKLDAELRELALAAQADLARTDSPLPLDARQRIAGQLAASHTLTRADIAQASRRARAARSMTLETGVSAGSAFATAGDGGGPQRFAQVETEAVLERLGRFGPEVAADIVEAELATLGLSGAARDQVLSFMTEARASANVPGTRSADFLRPLLQRALGASQDGVAGGIGSFTQRPEQVFRTLATTGVVSSALADRFELGEFVTPVEFEAHLRADGVDSKVRAKALAAIRAAGRDGGIRAADAVRILRETGVVPRAVSGSERGGRVAGAEDGGVAWSASDSIRALRDSGIVSAQIVSRLERGESLTAAEFIGELRGVTEGQISRTMALETARQMGIGTSEVSLAALSRFAQTIGGVGRAAIGGGHGLVDAVTARTKVPLVDTAVHTARFSGEGVLRALAERGLVPMSLADRSMLGDFVSAVEVEALMTARGINSELRRDALDALAAERSGPNASRDIGRDPAASVKSGHRAGATSRAIGGDKALAARLSSSSMGELARTSLNAGVLSSLSLEHAAALRVLTERGVHPMQIASADLDMVLSQLVGDRVAVEGREKGVGERVAKALALSAAGPAGATRLAGAAARMSNTTGDSAEVRQRGPVIGAPIDPSRKATDAGLGRTAASGFVRGWSPSASSVAEELTRPLSVRLESVMAPEVMLSGTRSLEVSKSIREMAIRGDRSFESLGVLTTLADSGIDLGAGRTATAERSDAASDSVVQRMVDRARRSGGASAGAALSEILVRGADPVQALSRARLSRRERAGLLSSILRGAEKAERASIFEGAGAADFAFEWLARVDGSKSGVDVGMGEARDATARTFGARRDNRIAASSPLADANLVSSAGRGGHDFAGAGGAGIAPHARPVAQALAGRAPQADAIRRTDWRLVDTGTRGATSHADLGKLASALVGNRGTGPSAVPMALVAPAAKSVAQTALRAGRGDQAKSTGPAPDPTNTPRDAGAGEFSMSEEALELLAVEMAGLVAEIFESEKERTGQTW